jgi:carnitine O-acetyltransferase
MDMVHVIDVGMNYMLAKNLIKIGVESKISCKDTSSRKYVDTLRQVFDDMKVMVEAALVSKL